MNANVLGLALINLIASHANAFANMGTRQYQLLELGALMLTAEHYRRAGYEVRAENLRARLFRVKMGTNGYPWNFSRFVVSTAGVAVCEVHSNLSVESYYQLDEGYYCVDVAVARPGTVPIAKTPWRGLPNRDLLTFAEAKALVVYPMLLAQFVGIVHELMPDFLGSASPCWCPRFAHFRPSLIALDYLHRTAASVYAAFPVRGFNIRVVCDSDWELTELSRDSARPSPLS
jgi:hypothetical protein